VAPNLEPLLHLKGGIALRERILAQVRFSIEGIHTKFLSDTPVVFGDTLDKWQGPYAQRVGYTISGWTYNPAIAAAVLEEGSRAHDPPFQRILDWAIAKFGDDEDSRRIASGTKRNIKQRGLRDKHTFDYRVVEHENRLMNALEATMENWMMEWGKKLG
jgi:hypothetical protein